MDTTMIQTLYERFRDRMRDRNVRVDYDARHDTLYAFGEVPWDANNSEKPRTLAVVPGIHLDVLLSTQQVYGVEIEDFDRALHDLDNPSLRSWWEHMHIDGQTTVDGEKVSQVLEHASIV